jgi:peptidoglycan/LPS O-acetylase OafA/YrhL
MNSNDTHSQVPSTYRIDIQSLRGLAVTFVVLYHAKLGFLEAGHLGVDIFFVISGYLITGIIQSNIERGTFSFGDFYLRRAKRLLPAAYVTFFVTVILSGIFLTSIEMQDFVMQLLGAVTFTGNIALWLQAGYFEGEAHFKPLLHVWSLAIEEQYYLLLPAAMVIVPRKYWTVGTALLLGISLILCLALGSIKPGATFYLLPTRAWELLIGSLGVLTLERSRAGFGLSRLFWPALIALFLIPVFPIGHQNPGLDAVIVCVATLVVILRRHPILNEGIISRVLAKIGGFSYSLYLVHWPLFSFANNAYVSDVPIGVRIFLFVLSFVLGYFLYRFVEAPVKAGNFQSIPSVFGLVVTASIALIAFALFLTRLNQPITDFSYVLRGNHGFGEACEFGAQFTPLSDCRNSADPSILVWGDSFAKHLVPGIVSSSDLGVIQATKAVCGPFIHLAPFDKGDYSRPFAEDCLKFNASVLDYLSRNSSIEVVVLSSPFAQYLDANAWGGRGFRSLLISDGKFVEDDPDIDVTIQSMRETVLRIRALGKRVVVVAPPPSANFNIGACLERKATEKLTLGTAHDCQILVSEYHTQQALVLEFLARLPHEAGVNVVRFDEFLCSSLLCLTQIDGTFIYRDGSHFTYDGSSLIAEKMGLVKRIYTAAF